MSHRLQAAIPAVQLTRRVERVTLGSTAAKAVARARERLLLPRHSDGMLLLVAVAEYQDAEVFGLRSRVSKSTRTSPQRWE